MIEKAIVDAAAALRRAREPYLVATVMRVRGSAYRRAGARLILGHDRRIAGEISGGCLEGDVAMRGWWRARGAPAVVTYDSRIDGDATDDEIRAAFAVGCNGVIDVLLERVEPGRDAARDAGTIDPLELAGRCLATQRRAAIATIYRASGPRAADPIGARLAVIADDRARDVERELVDPRFPADRGLRAAIAADLAAAIADGVSRDHIYGADGAQLEVSLEVLVPPPRLFVLGGGPDAVPVVDLARALGWDALACVPRPSPALRERFARADGLLVGEPRTLAAAVDRAACAAAVVMAHDLALDRAHLGALCATRARYVGVLGPRHRTERMLAELGLDPRVVGARLHAPVGLDVGAETPAEIALAIVGEIQAVIAGRSLRGLRDRAGSIHERERDDDESLPVEAPVALACGVGR